MNKKVSSYRASQLIAIDQIDANVGIENIKAVIEEFENRDWVKKIVFKKGQKLLYPVNYYPAENKILLAVYMSDENGELDVIQRAVDSDLKNV